MCDLLDAYQVCFSDKPGFCSYFEHHIEISKDFKPKRLREYRIPELMKPEVQRQIDELARDGFIVPSSSPMASPLVCVLKGKDAFCRSRRSPQKLHDMERYQEFR